MGEPGSIIIDQQIERLTAETLERGYKYADAFRFLDPTLNAIQTNDIAAGFDVGSGADGVAFHTLGFQHAIVTNDPSASLLFFKQHVNHEERVQSSLQEHSPNDTRYSSLAASDWLEMVNFHPRLTTMLRIRWPHLSRQ